MSPYESSCKCVRGRGRGPPRVGMSPYEYEECFQAPPNRQARVVERVGMGLRVFQGHGAPLSSTYEIRNYLFWGLHGDVMNLFDK